MVFDKTGTLTRGEIGVVGIASDGASSEERVLALAVGLEQGSEHPLGRAIVEEASSRGVKPATVSNFESLKGRGVSATVDGHDAYVGGPHLLDSLGLTADGDLDAELALKVTLGGLGVLQHIVEEAGRDRGHVHLEVDEEAGYLKRVGNVRLAGGSLLAPVRTFREPVCPLQDLQVCAWLILRYFVDQRL